MINKKLKMPSVRITMDAPEGAIAVVTYNKPHAWLTKVFNLFRANKKPTTETKVTVSINGKLPIAIDIFKLKTWEVFTLVKPYNNAEKMVAQVSLSDLNMPAEEFKAIANIIRPDTFNEEDLLKQLRTSKYYKSYVEKKAKFNIHATL